MTIYTLGFVKKKAKEFFAILKENKIEQLVDIRFNNTSQLAGFTKKEDLEYFLKELCNITYSHFEFLAPTKEIRNSYNRNEDWQEYTKKYLNLLREREILKKLDKSFFQKRTCFLCSEPIPDYCHRKLLVDYLKEHWRDIEIIHL